MGEQMGDTANREMGGQQSSSTKKWLLGCGIGCGVILIIGIVVLVAGGIMAKRVIDEGLEQVRVQMVPELASQYETLKASDKVPQEHAALLDEVFNITQRDDVSVWGVMMAGGVLMEALQDGDVSDQEMQDLQTVEDLLKNNPDMGMMEMGTAIGENPRLQRAFQNMQQYQPGM